MPDTSTLSSERAIANLLAAYAFRNDDADIAGLGNLFADAVFTLDGSTAHGKAEIEAMAAAIIPIGADGRSATSHEITNISIEIDEVTGKATAQSYWTLYHAVSGKPRQAFLAGRYQDAFTRREGRWAFTRRDAQIRWSTDLPTVIDAAA
jgi:hypothetical protein